MKARQLLLLLCAFCCLGQLAVAREAAFEHKLLHIRSVLQTQAAAGASGQQSASAAAMATNIGGQGQAQTASEATGGQTMTFGLSSAQGQVDVCFNTGGNYSACRTLAPSVRASNCTDIPPDDRFTCQQQAVEYKKCNEGFMFDGSYCLKSCNRCGANNCNDNDKPVDGSACDKTKCDSSMYKSRPTCLKTCQRCSTVEPF